MQNVKESKYYEKTFESKFLYNFKTLVRKRDAFMFDIGDLAKIKGHKKVLRNVRVDDIGIVEPSKVRTYDKPKNKRKRIPRLDDKLEPINLHKGDENVKFKKRKI